MLNGDIHGVIVIEDSITRVQILNEVVCFSHHTNTLGKDMNPNILLSIMGKY